MRRPRIDLLAPPFAGHLHPILGMARALKSDYEVRALTAPSANSSVRAAGFEALTLLGGWEDRLRAVVDTGAAVGSHPVRLYRQFSAALAIHERVGVELDALYRDSRPDLLIADFTLLAAGPLARRLGIPWWTSLPSPCVLEGGDGPPCYFGGLKPRAGFPGAARDVAARFATRLFKRFVAATFRAPLRRIGLSSLYRADGSETIYSQERILCLGWPALEFRTRWPSCVRFIPPMLYTPPIRAASPNFAGSRPHVLITMGTHLSFTKDAAAQQVRAAARLSPGIDFHFTDGEIEGDRGEHDGNFRRLSFIDYQQQLARYDLVVHHGGSGVMYHCLAAGRPALVLPVDYDQFDNAARLEHAGLARRLRDLKSLSSQVESVLADAGLNERCRRFAERHDVSAAPGVFKAEVDAWFQRERGTAAMASR